MPNWLRRALIEAMAPERAREVRDALRRLIEAARESGDPAHDESVRMRILREAPKDRLTPDELFEDDVLLDFMARGKIEDFELPQQSLLDRFVPKEWRQRLGAPEAAMLGVCGAWAGAAFAMTPKAGEGALVTGAWLPLIALVIGGALAYALTHAGPTYLAMRATLERLAPTGLAFAGSVGIQAYAVPVVLAGLGSGVGAIGDGSQATSPIWAPLSLLVVIAWLSLVPLARWLVERAGVYGAPPKGGWLRRLAGVLGELALVTAATVVALALIDGRFGSDGARRLAQGMLAAAGFVVFGLGLLAARYVPEQLPPPRKKSLGARAGFGRGLVKAGLALAPMAPAFLIAAHLGDVHQRIPGVVEAGREIARAPEAEVSATTPDGKFFVLGGADGRVRVFASATPEAALSSIVRQQGPVASLALRQPAEKPMLVAVATSNGTVRLYDARDGSLVTDTGVRSFGAPPLVALGDDGGWAASFEDRSGAAQVVINGRAPIPFEGGPVTALAALADGGYAVGLLSGAVAIVSADNAAARQIRSVSQQSHGSVRSISYEPQGANIRVVYVDGFVREIATAPDLGDVIASAAGRVVFAGPQPIRGIVVEIDHGQGFKTRYSNLKKVSVRLGDRIDVGDVIGQMESSRSVVLRDVGFDRRFALGAAIEWRRSPAQILLVGKGLVRRLGIGASVEALGCVQPSTTCLRAVAALLQAAPTAEPIGVESRETSGFGARMDPFTGRAVFHTGLDFTAFQGAPIVAPVAGVVVFAGVKSGYGNTIDIDHGQGFKTRYAHLRAINVSLGARVTANERIGQMGSTGRSTGTQLHYEIWYRGRAYDPIPFLRSRASIEEWLGVARPLLGADDTADGDAPRPLVQASIDEATGNRRCDLLANQIRLAQRDAAAQEAQGLGAKRGISLPTDSVRALQAEFERDCSNATAADSAIVSSNETATPGATPGIQANDAPASIRAPRSFSAVYSVSSKGIQAGDFSFGVRFENGAYEATASRRMTGVARSLIGDAQDYRYEARGEFTSTGLTPQFYRHEGGKRKRVVSVDFSGPAPVTTATPAMGMGDPPATDEQKAGAIDQVTMLASLVATAGDPCDRTLRVLMDGRSRFDMQFEPNGNIRMNSRAYSGPAVRCSVQFRPIAGFPDPQSPATLTFIFAPIAPGAYVPLRIEMPTDVQEIGLAVLEARSFQAN